MLRPFDMPELGINEDFPFVSTTCSPEQIRMNRPRIIEPLTAFKYLSRTGSID